MAKIKIDEGDLLDLLEDHSGWRTGYLDTQTGEILQMLEDSDDADSRTSRSIRQAALGRGLRPHQSVGKPGERVASDPQKQLAKGVKDCTYRSLEDSVTLQRWGLCRYAMT